MRGFARAAVLATVLAAGTSIVPAFEGNVNVFLGQKWFVDAAWEPVDTQPEIGILFAFGETRSPIHFALDVFHSEDDEPSEIEGLGPVNVEGKTTEYALGIRKVFRRFAITHPHLGGGATLAQGDLKMTIPGAGRSDVDDAAFGFWIDGGITWRVASHLNLGVEVRYSRYTFSFGSIFADNDVRGGGFHAGALIGYGW